MNNPLNRRFFRELKDDIGKYLVIFIFLAGMIAIVSGFLVAGESMTAAYDESYEKYNVEDGNFVLANEASDEDIDSFETASQYNTVIYPNFYQQGEVSSMSSRATLRLYSDRTSSEAMNKVCLIEGNMPENEDEICLDRNFAINNEVTIGDSITFLGRDFTICGYVAMPDYCAPFEKPNETMFDARIFGTGIVTQDAFDSFDDTYIHYQYSWRYETTPKNDAKAKTMGDDYLEKLIPIVYTGGNSLVSFTPGYMNQAISFPDGDITKDQSMIITFMYLCIVIMAFVFAITANSTILKESRVIGTLRASGYSKVELILHYLALPMFVVLLAGIVGNICGYTVVKDFAANMYYRSYSLPTYVTLWNTNAFIKTTIIPLVAFFVIELVSLIWKFRFSPLDFLRQNITSSKRKKAIRLNSKIGIQSRFRLRVILQNLPNYAMIFIGVFFANVILVFGCVLSPMLSHYADTITSSLLCEHQYVLKNQVELANSNEGSDEEVDAERFGIQSLIIESGDWKEPVITYGIVPNSRYIDIDNFGTDDEIPIVSVSNALAEKFNLGVGDVFTLDEEFENRSYEFEVGQVIDFPGSIAIFMEEDAFNKVFDLEEGSFSGYFSNTNLVDEGILDESNVATEISRDDYLKISRQVEISIGDLMQLFSLFGILVFMLIVYLLSKIVIEKNATSISMIKILGYRNGEINKIYVAATSIIVVLSIVITVPLASMLMSYLVEALFMSFNGWIPYYAPPLLLPEMCGIGIVSYAVIAFFMTLRIKKASLSAALKINE